MLQSLEGQIHKLLNGSFIVSKVKKNNIEDAIVCILRKYINHVSVVIL